jgi:hypothetical protein
MSEHTVTGQETAGTANDGHVPGADLSFLNDARESVISAAALFMYGDRNWAVNNSTMYDYSRRAYIGGSATGLLDIVNERLDTSEDNVGLDLAAGTYAQALHDLLDSGVLNRALATNYSARLPRRARRQDLDYLTGNLTRRDTWQAILGWQGEHAPEGFDLVMHRPVGGLQDLDLDTYKAGARILFDIVKPGGMMFSQVPRHAMNDEGGLRELCRSVRSGGQVEDVVTTGERPSKKLPKDESDFYAVLLKAA